MKRSLKVLSVLMSVVLLFAACGKITPENTINEMKSYFENNDYKSCKSYISSIDAEIKNQISNEALDIIENEFVEIYEKYKTYDIFDITRFDDSFIENCAKLWEIASEFTPSEEKNANENLQYLRYFSAASDAMRYKEMFRMLKKMYNCGYFYWIQKSLNDYSALGDYSHFDTAKETASEFNYSDYNPQEYYISELRSACEKIIKPLTSVTNGFATNDTAVVASAINNIYEISGTFLYACDCAEAVYSSLSEAMNTFRIQGAFAEYKNEITFGEARKYTEGTEFGLSNIFGESYTPPDSNDSENDGATDNQTNVSKQEAVRIAVNAINKTKAYKSGITVNRRQTVNIQMTSFNTESEITSAVSIIRIQINDALKNAGGTSTASKHFVNGMCDEISLNDSIPPSGKAASLDASFVESYTAVKGSGGYVITFNLPSCTSTDDNISYNLLSIVDGFYFDNGAENIKYKTFYGPTAISLVVNNSGYLSKYDYAINGVANCKFTENGQSVATGEFSFNQQYNYEFIY
ncbi:MAG: hypothetical protein J1F37_01450 [Oscillospiraceae bacterium]|nr:hypothetical protein [Oscillospiraceae bacterium]